jgi:putative phosphoribosyl transferase
VRVTEGGITLFRNRREAGRVLAELLERLVGGSTALVLALPRGGVPVGFEVARNLRLDLDVFLVRKLGMPGDEELAIGAVATGGVRVLNHDLIDYLCVPDELVEQVTERELTELERRERLYREDRPAIPVEGRSVILVDDGLATGASMLAASRALRPQGASRIIVAVPVAARKTCEDFRKEVDAVVCAATPHPFGAVGSWYEDFAQITDEEVRKYLEMGAQTTVARPARV